MTLTPTPAPLGLPSGLTVEDAVRIAAALEASLAPATRILYAHTWRVWARWCAQRGLEPLPADPAALAAYLVERAADGTAVVSLDVACVAIRHVHLQHGLPNPAETELVRQVRLGLRRTYGTAPRRLARPLTTTEIRQILAAIDTSVPIGIRDTAIILLGYASAMRGSELAELTLADIDHKPAGILVTIRHSKTDQEHHGQRVAVAHGTHAATDPVAALAAWTRLRRQQLGDDSQYGPGEGAGEALFTRIWQTRISDQPLGKWVVARMLRQRAEQAGLDGTRITAHSLRAGHATTAALAGVPLHRIAAQTRHKDLGVLLNRYIRPVEALATTSSRDLGL
ncbi:integrase [Nocardioides sp. Root1257]|uniref:tyrosine-type recombinase/integrase n=1 Tax=unclassified Nocardioides TaxID=2615069 RepID=UPI0006FF56EB|nr:MULTISPECIES: tyrosine-type recombinase/integrase [unclassified Nocardioides]KQW45065.1 integrase [Nocardioides sp. Root1257]KRC45931.1 integrase [Nocardioides sp. Root224]